MKFTVELKNGTVLKIEGECLSRNEATVAVLSKARQPILVVPIDELRIAFEYYESAN